MVQPTGADRETGRWAHLAARVLRPERPRLAEARAVVAGVPTVAGAWAALTARGLVPGDAPTRGARPGGAYRTTQEEPAARWHPWDNSPPGWPTTVDAAVALASDPDGLVRAGANALTALDRLRRHGAITTEATRVAWRVVEPGWHPVGLPAAVDALASLAAVLGDLPRRTTAWREVTMAARRRGVAGEGAAADAAGSLLWQRAVAQGRPGYTLEDDPFAALVAVWAEGYAVDCTDRGCVVLAAPAV